jgi:tripartite-type tricarboxylate transporter receptor subunit TctC
VDYGSVSSNFIPDLISGRVQGTFGFLPLLLEHIRAGMLHSLAVGSATRLEVLPDTPTINEFVPGYEASSWFGVGAPKGTSTEIIEKLNKEINAVVADPKIRARLAELGSVPMQMTPVEFGKLIADETEKWGKVIRAANIKPE